jgi:hypothetical protein
MQNCKIMRMIKSGPGRFNNSCFLHSLRLIENQRNPDSINAYYQMQKYFDYRSGLQRQRINDVISGNEKLFDGFVFSSLINR